MPTPGSEIEITLDDAITEITPNSGGEGVKNQSDKAISEDDILDLKRELEAAKAEREAAKRGETAAHQRTAEVERTARDTTQRLSTEVTTRLVEQANIVDSGITSTQGEIDALRDSAAKAMEEGRWADAAKAQEDISDAKLRMRELTFQKGEIARYQENAKKAPVQQQPQVGTKTQAWIASHPKFNTDKVYRAKALLAHEECEAEGIPIESEEYFKKVEEMTGDRKAEAAPAAPIDKKETPGANDNDGGTRFSGAPVQRRAPSGNGDGNRKTIRLSAEQVEAADAMFGEPGTAMFIKDPKERYTYWHSQTERLKTEGRI